MGGEGSRREERGGESGRKGEEREGGRERGGESRRDKGRGNWEGKGEEWVRDEVEVRKEEGEEGRGWKGESEERGGVERKGEGQTKVLHTK